MNNNNDVEKKLDQLLESLPKAQYDTEAWLAEDHVAEYDRIVSQHRRKAWLRWGSVAAVMVGVAFMIGILPNKESEIAQTVPMGEAIQHVVTKPVVQEEKPLLAESEPPKQTPTKKKSQRATAPQPAVRQMTPIDSLADIVERIELAMQGVRDSCYMANVEKLMHTDDRLQHLVNQLILEGITADPDINTAFTDLQHND